MNGRQRGFAATRFGQVHYWLWGEGPLLLMLHQSAQSSDEYLRIAPHLADGFRLLAIDQPGHGPSGDPDHELSVAEHTSAIIDVLDELGVNRCDVFGHHGGAYLGVSLAAACPGRVGKAVFSGLGMLSQATIDSLLNQPMSRDLPLDEAGEFLRRTWSVYRRMSAAGAPPDVTSLPFCVSLDARTRPYDMHFAILRWDASEALARHAHPTLLLRGEEDLYSGDVEAVHALMPDSHYGTVRGGGAWLMYEQPEACAALVREFLDG
ncbi:MAG: alpha/beta hydrolase [Woeseiaceae bacterium]|nr:alpha/beta hydrolase [Woeseiaceae bacterium]